MDMEPVVRDAEDGEELTDTDPTESEDSDSTPSQSRSSSVYAQETDLDVFEGYLFKGRHSVIIDDDDDNSDLYSEEGGYEESDEGVSASVSLVSEDVKDQENVVDTEGQAAGTGTQGEPQPRIPEARLAMLPAAADVPTEETKPIAEPTQPAHTTEPPAPTKRPSAEVSRPSADSQRSETSSKSRKPLTSPKSPTAPRSPKQAGKRRDKSGIASLDRYLGGGNDELAEREEEYCWDFVEAGVNEEWNRTKGTSLFARGVVDRYKLAVFPKSTPFRHGNRTVSGTSKTSGREPASPSPLEKQGMGRKPRSFRNKKNISKTLPTSYSSRTGVPSKHTLAHSSCGTRGSFLVLLFASALSPTLCS